MQTVTPSRPSLRSSLLRSLLLRGKNTTGISASIAKSESEEVNGKPDPPPDVPHRQASPSHEWSSRTPS